MGDEVEQIYTAKRCNDPECLHLHAEIEIVGTIALSCFRRPRVVYVQPYLATGIDEVTFEGSDARLQVKSAMLGRMEFLDHPVFVGDFPKTKLHGFLMYPSSPLALSIVPPLVDAIAKLKIKLTGTEVPPPAPLAREGPRIGETIRTTLVL